MEKVMDDEFLEELKFFRWTLYHYGTSKETTNNSTNNDTDSDSENENKSTRAISIENEDIIECEDIIGSLIRYHCEQNHGEIIAEELVIAKFGIGKVSLLLTLHIFISV